MRVSLRPRTERFEQSGPMPTLSVALDSSPKIIPRSSLSVAVEAMGSEALRLPDRLLANDRRLRHRSAMQRTMARFRRKNQSVAAASWAEIDVQGQSLSAEQRMLLLLKGLESLQEEFQLSNVRPFDLRP